MWQTRPTNTSIPEVCVIVKRDLSHVTRDPRMYQHTRRVWNCQKRPSIRQKRPIIRQKRPTSTSIPDVCGIPRFVAGGTHYHRHILNRQTEPRLRHQSLQTAPRGGGIRVLHTPVTRTRAAFFSLKKKVLPGGVFFREEKTACWLGSWRVWQCGCGRWMGVVTQ